MMTTKEPLAERTTQDLAVALGNTDVIGACWEPDDEGVQPDGVMGGDGAGESVSVRYLNRHLPSARITTYFHVVDLRDRLGADDENSPFFVEEMTEYYVADGPVIDPDAPEVWSDYEYGNHPRTFATEAAAEAERDRLAVADDAGHYMWNGDLSRASR